MIEDSDHYIIKINNTQKRIIQEALDLYYRIQMGQFKIILEMLLNKNNYPSDNWREIHDRCAENLNFVKVDLFPELNNYSYHSIHSHEIHDDSRIAADIHDILKFGYSWPQASKESEPVIIRHIKAKASYPYYEKFRLYL